MRLLFGLLFVSVFTFGAAAHAQDLAPSESVPPPDPVEMTLGQAAVLGVIEGLTEYLPVSSTGHLIVAQRMMGIGSDEASADAADAARADTPGAADSADAANAFAICIQGGAIVAVLGLYFRRVRQMGRGLVGRDIHGRSLLLNLLVAFIPAAVFGLLLDELIEHYLFGLWPIVGAWAAGGLIILIVSWLRAEKMPPAGIDLEHLSRRRALAIGLVQCIAMWPGVSRSLVTIVGGVVVGLSLPAAVEFSFLLGVVTLTAATAYKAVQYGPQMIEAYGVATMLVGFLTATVSAVIAVEWMVRYLNRHGLAIFGYYRVAIAALVAALILAGVV